MTSEAPYVERKLDVVRVLEDHARRHRKLTYGDLGKLVGIPAQGPWKPLLDEISRDHTGRGLPDITHLVVGADTRYSHQINFEDARNPTVAQKAEADRIIDAVFRHYSAKS